MPCRNQFVAIGLIAISALSSGCVTVVKPELLASIPSINEVLSVVVNPGSIQQLIPRRQRQSYCRAINLGSETWSPEFVKQLERTELTGVIKLRHGASYPWRATTYRPLGKWNGKVLWYFHGICGNGDFAHSAGTEAIYEALNEGGRPVVIGISLGEAWLMNPGIREELVHVMHRVLEDQHVPTGGNWLLGFSMGGFNALRLYVEPPEGLTFEKCVVVAPCLPSSNPYANRHSLRAQSREGGGISFLKMEAAFLVKSFFPQAESWAEVNPLAHPDHYQNLPLLILAGTRDEFGFQRTAEQFARDANAPFILFEGSHRIPDGKEAIAAIVKFLGD